MGLCAIYHKRSVDILQHKWIQNFMWQYTDEKCLQKLQNGVKKLPFKFLRRFFFINTFKTIHKREKNLILVK